MEYEEKKKIWRKLHTLPKNINFSTFVLLQPEFSVFHLELYASDQPTSHNYQVK